jgi:HK97 family phage prohead protease
MKTITRYAQTPEQEFTDDRSIQFVFSTEDLDSHGSIISQDWDLSRYVAGGSPVFFNHDASIPVGTAESVRVEAGQLVGGVRFLTDDLNPLAERLYQLYKRKLMRGASIRATSDRAEWIDKNKGTYRLSGNTLLEISLTGLPSNPNSLSRSEQGERMNLDELFSEIAAALSCAPSHDAVLGAVRAVKTEADAVRAKLEAFERSASDRESADLKAQIESLPIERSVREWLGKQSTECVRSFIEHAPKASAPTRTPVEGSSLEGRFEGLTVEELAAKNDAMQLRRCYQADRDMWLRVRAVEVK